MARLMSVSLTEQAVVGRMMAEFHYYPELGLIVGVVTTPGGVAGNRLEPINERTE